MYKNSKFETKFVPQKSCLFFFCFEVISKGPEGATEYQKHGSKNLWNEAHYYCLKPLLHVFVLTHLVVIESLEGCCQLPYWLADWLGDVH